MVFCRQSQEVIDAIRKRAGEKTFLELIEFKDEVGIEAQPVGNGLMVKGNSPIEYMTKIKSGDPKASTSSYIRTGNPYTDHVVNYGLEGTSLERLEKQANAPGKYNIRPLSWAVILHDKKLFSSLLALNTPPKLSAQEMAYIIESGEPVETAEAKPKSGKKTMLSIDATDTEAGWTALHIAALLNERQMVEMLISAGARQNSTDTFGNTYKTYLEEHEHAGNLMALLRAGESKGNSG